MNQLSKNSFVGVIVCWRNYTELQKNSTNHHNEQSSCFKVETIEIFFPPWPGSHDSKQIASYPSLILFCKLQQYELVWFVMLDS